MVEQINPTDSHTLYILVPCIVFLFVPVFFVITRWWSRMLLNGVGIDDWVICVSMLFAMAHGSVLIAACHYGFGKHKVTLSTHNLTTTMKLFWTSQIFYKMSINLTKVAILLLYARIFVQKPFRVLCWVLMGLVMSYCTASVVVGIFQCTPLPRYWDRAIPGTCIDTQKFWYANGSFNIVTDVIIILLPMPVFYTLRLRRQQKVALMFIFALGSFVIVTSIFRMTTLSFSAKSPDTTYDIFSTCWTIVECNVAIICACLPTIRPVLTRIFPRIFPSTTKAHGRSYAQNLGSGGHSSTSRSANKQWIPQRGDGEDIMHLSRVAGRKSQLASHHDDKGSEEYILQGAVVEDKVDGSNESTHLSKGVIHKQVDVSVQYSRFRSEESVGHALGGGVER